MRIPSNSFTENTVSQLHKLNGQQQRLQNQVATGQQFTQPADNPAAAGRALRIGSEKAQLQQFSANTATALDISRTSFSSLEQLKELSDRAGEIGVLGSGINSADAYSAYRAEVNQMIEQAVQTANAKFGGNHLFGGTRTDAAPFAVTRDPGGTVSSVAYAGTAAGAEVRVSESTTISPYTDGTTNEGFATFINRLVSLRDALGAKDPAAVTTAREDLLASEDDLLVATSHIGSVQSRLEVEAARSSARFASLEDTLSREVDVDLAQTLVRLSQSQTAYQAALQSGAQIMNLSLLDYVR